MADLPKVPLTTAIRQSPPVDLTKAYDIAWIKGKHALITGGASGFGEGFVRKWAQAGASVVISDINVEKGDQVARHIRKDTGNENVFFIACDVRDWQQQVNMFKEAVRLSPHGGIDIVVANAGIAGIEPFMLPLKMDGPEPQKPNFKLLDVNIYGVVYTTQLALHYLPQNPGSKPASPDSDPAATNRDRHLILVGSLASLAPIPGSVMYGTSKHAVLGLFRSLRSSTFVDGIRVNMLCPYFVHTGILPTAARLLLAGSGLGTVEDVVDAGSRLAADTRIVGRALCIGPKARMKQREEDGEWVVLPSDSIEGEEQAIWEAYADDFTDSEAFTYRMVNVLKGVAYLKGWSGWISDVAAALKYGIFGK
jgi:NAD(P)-dependent dehydrogenase (short-subunit alcohol dehydrogenase family)